MHYQWSYFCLVLSHWCEHQHALPSVAQIMAWYLFSTKSLSDPMVAYCLLDHKKKILVKFESKCKNFDIRKLIWNCHLWNFALIAFSVSILLSSAISQITLYVSEFHKVFYSHQIICLKNYKIFPNVFENINNFGYFFLWNSTCMFIYM